MPKKSHVWKHFTPARDENGNTVGKAKCNYCSDNKEFDSKAGTSNMWRHFLKHFTRTIPDDQGNEKGIMQCNVCQAKLKASSAITSLVEHIEACNRVGAAAAAASRPPAVQTSAPLGFGSSSSMDLEPADHLGAQPPQQLPSAPSRPAGGSSSGGGAVPDMDEANKRLARMIALHGFDPSIVENDGFKSFVESLNPEFRVPKRVEVEDICDHIFDEEKEDRHRRMYYRYRGRTSLAVGKAKILEREVVYKAHHFIDDDWNLHKQIMRIHLDGPSPYHHGKLDGCSTQICVESQLVEIVRGYGRRWFDKSGDADYAFMVAWGITKDHLKLEGYIHQNLPNSYAVRRGLVCTTFMDVMFHSVAEHLYLQINAQFCEHMHSKVAFITRKQRDILLSHAGVDLWAYNEAWYSWYCYLVVLQNEDPDAEPELTRLLCNIWGAIYHSIKTISTPKLPTSNLCLIELFNVKKVLDSELLARATGGRSNHHRGCAAFIASKDIITVLIELINILDKAIQESYLVWSIPLVLDPRYNLAGVEEAFRGAFGEAAGSYISKTIEHIKVIYSEYVEEEEEEDQDDVKAELDRYLNVSVVHPTEGFDILNWWKVHGSHHYPTVALMARDALAMPTSSQLSSEQIAHVKSMLD